MSDIEDVAFEWARRFSDRNLLDLWTLELDGGPPGPADSLVRCRSWLDAFVGITERLLDSGDIQLARSLADPDALGGFPRTDDPTYLTALAHANFLLGMLYLRPELVHEALRMARLVERSTEAEPLARSICLQIDARASAWCLREDELFAAGDDHGDTAQRARRRAEDAYLRGRLAEGHALIASAEELESALSFAPAKRAAAAPSFSDVAVGKPLWMMPAIGRRRLTDDLHLRVDPETGLKQLGGPSIPPAPRGPGLGAYLAEDWSASREWILEDTEESVVIRVRAMSPRGQTRVTVSVQLESKHALTDQALTVRMAGGAQRIEYSSNLRSPKEFPLRPGRWLVEIEATRGQRKLSWEIPIEISE